MLLDLSGYTLSGKTAVIDLLREFDGCSVPDKEFEFGLLRMKDGLFDLEHALVNDWSPIRSDAAVRKFRNLIYLLSSEYKKYSFKWLLSPSGYNYRKQVNENFFFISKHYLDSLVSDYEDVYWPFALHDDGAFECARSKFLYLFSRNKIQTHRKIIAKGERFYKLTQNYLSELLENNDPSAIYVLHNSLEPYRANDASRFFKNGKCIVIDRDPRVIYATSLKSPYAGYKSVHSFIEQFNFTRSKAKFSSDCVLKVNLENLIYNYDNELLSIKKFVGLDNEQHKRKKQYFNPEISKKYAEEWKFLLSRQDVALIEEKLEKFCFEF
ncbi:hypothetical protein ACOIPL_003327 [Vibrio fluvialis]|nr:hypothetical protein [Vibrio fluvialis]ELF6481672.1 hypothetical protein [Vibrio fluvialis]ELG4658245.1 hypothetical protein [Vibrio fluvialis]ELI1812577.1 hypothetical protein [Vibrio fluvialis]